MSSELLPPRAANRLAWMGWRLYDPRVRALLYQFVLAAAVGLAAWYVVANTAENLQARGIASGFHFLFREAGFEISETTFLSYSAASTYLRALAVGVFNTLRVAALAIVLATLLGALIGLARLSRNWLVARSAAAYVEVIRNVPLLVQLFFWYALITEYFPAPAAALNPLPGIFISNRGIVFPLPRSDLALEYPELAGFNFTGGGALSPEFAALLLGLVIYTASFIAEIVRAGIQAVSHGQTEAASALGLRNSLTLRLVIIPQAMRIIIPPLASQYLNLTKNSSLAVAIAYPDLVATGGTVLNQTGQAVEIVAIWMTVYLTLSLLTSSFMNWYNSRMRLVER